MHDFIRISLELHNNIGNESLKNILFSEEIFDSKKLAILFYWNIQMGERSYSFTPTTYLPMVLLTYIFSVELTVINFPFLRKMNFKSTK